MPRFQLLIAAIEFAATLAFALSGFIEAARRRMDVVGVFAVAFITAFGGGTVRDVLLDRRPFFWVEHQAHVWLIFLLSLAAVPWLRARHHRFTERAILIPDALGLGLFTVTGVSLAYEAGMPVFVSAMMGVITGVFGGVMRDVICNEVPYVFRDHRPYALCAFVGAWAYLGMNALDVTPLVSLGVAVVLIAGLRLLAVLTGWSVPGWRED
ncbi:trimeric intracellular cation channel family protein [Methyloversatilis sp.]|uniref:trimeric intracellular cation channel family protein n=1 Tax=Methyloversatilis sp. TaxID=2569862 RepID=UPI00273459E9|nr:trimeric intracellular cation channel family protein [Methyloversatilis sp.]MDP2868065.1 trimeric intracellular cation channel family protein [Methyloversatilis sp.]MDP3287075.1 trimeric intracellular cation channel family protein [Methyloversatilis sp.]MDP3454058.1 trimeric intracellular cation channel family protein [Methyloversatilis sp.]MDP3578224.1 trimeric intracellular cation channel family protein [Methyloversatilis sp.]